MLGVATVLFSASVSLAAVVRETPIAASWNPAPQGPTCVGLCLFCSLIEDKYQVTPNEDLKNDEDEDVQCGHHVECASECRVTMRDEMNRMVRVVAMADDRALRKLLNEVPDLSLNSERRALQLKGCGQGEVAAHLPLTAHQVAVLSN
jgi:hypothetical protein